MRPPTSVPAIISSVAGHDTTPWAAKIMVAVALFKPDTRFLVTLAER